MTVTVMQLVAITLLPPTVNVYKTEITYAYSLSNSATFKL